LLDREVRAIVVQLIKSKNFKGLFLRG